MPFVIVLGTRHVATVRLLASPSLSLPNSPALPERRRWPEGRGAAFFLGRYCRSELLLRKVRPALALAFRARLHR